MPGTFAAAMTVNLITLLLMELFLFGQKYENLSSVNSLILTQPNSWCYGLKEKVPEDDCYKQNLSWGCTVFMKVAASIVLLLPEVRKSWMISK